MSSVKKETPVMRQFRDAKKSHPDSVIKDPDYMFGS